MAAALNGRGAVAYADDHLGRGRSDGERALITDFEHVVDDLRVRGGLGRQPTASRRGSLFRWLRGARTWSEVPRERCVCSVGLM